MAALTLIAVSITTILGGGSVPTTVDNDFAEIVDNYNTFENVRIVDNTDVFPLVEKSEPEAVSVPAPPIEVPADALITFEASAVVVTPAPPPPPPPPAPAAPATVSRDASSRASSVGRAVGAPNGQIPGDALCSLSWDPASLLRCDAADALEAAAANGMPTVGMTDAYRSYASQVAVKASRGSFAATPGTSNHGYGVAIDVPEPARSWLHRNGAAYGWVNPGWAKTSKFEPWHFEFVR